MEYMVAFLSLALCASLVFNIKLFKAKKKEVLAADAKVLLAQLLNDGSAVVRVTCIDSGDFFLRSPRGL